MRRRAPEPSGAIPAHLRAFTLPDDDYTEVWAAWVAFDAELTAWELANPGHDDDVSMVRAGVPIPDEPFDVSLI